MRIRGEERAPAADMEQRLLTHHVRRRVVLPLLIFSVTGSIYIACVAGAVLLQDTAWKITLAILAGVFIANLAIIGHDAVHRSFTSVRWLNRLIGTLAFLPALHPFTRWEHHHNRIHHRYTAQIGVDNAFSPMTPDQYRAASSGRRLYYRFMRSLAGQPFFYMVDIWWRSMFLPRLSDTRDFRGEDWLDLATVHLFLVGFVFGLALLSQSWFASSFLAGLWNASLYGFVIPFLVWNLFISFVTIVQHTSPRVRWVLPTGRTSTYEQKLRGTVHVGFWDPLDWFFHRVMQHMAHHINPVVPLYALKTAEREVAALNPGDCIAEIWTPLYHWRLARDCKLYDPARDTWCDFDFQPTGQRSTALRAATVH